MRLLYSFLLLFAVFTTNAQTDSLDLSFGVNGKVQVNIGDTIQTDDNIIKTLLQPDGKIVSIGYYMSNISSKNEMVTLRFSSDGDLDTSFGTNGKAITNVTGLNIVINDAVLQNDGKILAVGAIYDTINASQTYNSSEFLLVRLDANGTLDSSFGINGFLILAKQDSCEILHSVSLEADGKIVAGGRSYGPSQTLHFCIFRFDNDGISDSTYGVNGKVHHQHTLSGNSTFKSGRTLVQPDGKVLIFLDQSYYYPALRFTSAGVLDSTFGVNGVGQLQPTTGQGMTPLFGYQTEALQPDGKILLAGYAERISMYAFRRFFFVARLNTNGFPDSTFGTYGYVTQPLIFDLSMGPADHASHYVRDLVVLADGKILQVGYMDAKNQKSHIHVKRLNINGTIDLSFNVNGSMTFSDLPRNLVSKNAVMQPDGKIIIGGYSRGNNNVEDDYILYRINNITTPLSVTLSSFSARAKEQSGILEWVTASEKKADKFVIERSADARGFAPIGEVKAIGSATSKQDYTFNDNAPLDGTNYYRLKMISLSGTPEYSETRSVTFSSISSIATTLYPNPVKETATLQYSLAKDGMVDITLVSAEGRIVQHLISRQFKSKGLQQQQINLPNNLTPGVYYLNITSDKQTEKVKLIK